jgi:histidinol-phosphate aminotransferase
MLNENPIPPSDKVIKAVTEIMSKGNRYPDSMLRLRTKLGKMHKMGPETSAFATALGDHRLHDEDLPPARRRVHHLHPTFELFPPRAELAGGKVVSVPLRKEDLQYDVDAMLKAINPKTKLILVINPNNPTGIFIDDKDLIRFCETGIPLCIDEAYLDYHPEMPSKDTLIQKYPHVFLSHTFSKAYGFAGIRFGYVVGTKEMVDAFNRMFLPWNVSLMAMAAAEAILDNPAEVEAKVKHNNRWMDVFTKELVQVGLKPFPPHGNYMLIDATMTGKTTAEILAAGLEMEHIFLKSIKPIHGRTAISG